jgi:outer membrane protein assembly factor BamB
MKYLSLVVTVLAAACTTQVAGQEELPPLFSDPVKLWETQLAADVNLGPTDILEGNGVFMGPDGSTAYVATLGATVYAFNAYTGAQLWTYQPEVIGTSITRSHSGLSFGPTADYMVYSVVDNENSLNPET